MVTVRPATVADAPAMGQLVVRAWQAAYRGQMPDDYLNGLRAEERAAYWDGVLRRADRRGVILVAERDGAALAPPARDRGVVEERREPRVELGPAQLLDNAAKPLGPDRVEAVGRFVENKYLLVAQQRLRQPETLQVSLR